MAAASRSARSAATHTERDPWLPGFAWALPAAFAGAVAACRFEQGDVLHAKRAGYGSWRKGPPGPWLQVLAPPRSARAGAGAAEESRFEAQWASPVEIDLAADAGERPRRVATTQGRLFTCLWHGDPDALGSATAPEPPRLLADLQRALDASLPSLREALSRTKRPSRADAAAMLFVAGIDWASDASLAKADAIATALAARFDIHLHDAPPAEAGVPEADRLHPALAVRGIRVEGADEAGVTAALKPALYGPGASGTADRFSLSRHGLLVPFLESED